MSAHSVKADTCTADPTCRCGFPVAGPVRSLLVSTTVCVVVLLISLPARADEASTDSSLVEFFARHGVGQVLALVFAILLVILLALLAKVVVQARVSRELSRRVDEQTRVLRRQQQLLTQAERIARVGSWEHEIATGRFVMSDQLYTLLGLDPAELLPSLQDRLDVIHPDDRQAFLKHEWRSVRKGKAYETEVRVRRHSDGDERVILHRVEPVFNDNGDLVRRIGVLSDITEQRSTENTFRRIFEQTPYPFMMIDSDGVIDCNPATLKMFDVQEKEDLLGRHPAEFSPPVQPDGTPSMEKAMKMIDIAFRDRFHRFEWTHRSDKGTDFEVEVNLSVFRADDEPVLMVVLHDLTWRRREEEKNRRMRELETLNRLAATLSHEFNNPLAVIRASAEMMAIRDDLPAESRTQLDIVIKHVSRIHELVGKLHKLRELREIDYAAGMKILDLHGPTGNGDDRSSPAND